MQSLDMGAVSTVWPCSMRVITGQCWEGTSPACPVCQGSPCSACVLTHICPLSLGETRTPSVMASTSSASF